LCHNRPIPFLGVQEDSKVATSIPKVKLRESSVVGARSSQRTSWLRLVVVGAALALVAALANVGVATASRSLLQVPAGFQPLTLPFVATFTVIGMIAATFVFAWTAQTRPNPIRTFVAIAVVGLFLSLLPDILIGVMGVFPGTTVAGILSLMALHVVAAACAVAILTRFGLR
jgi:drug/metabolite transporter (DMT)-like permease